MRVHPPLRFLFWFGDFPPCDGSCRHSDLQSTALQLEVTDTPYSFRVLERSTGEALLEQNRTALKETRAWATSLSNIQKTASSLSGTLITVGGGKAQITFTFTHPEVLQVSIRAADPATDEIYEEFKDHAGEHYYGVWEYPLGGNIDDRRADYDFLGMRRMPDVNYDSARAPYYMSSKKYAIYTESTSRGHYMFADENRTGFSSTAMRSPTTSSTAPPTPT